MSKISMRQMTVGQYTPTDSFKNIPSHSCVCYADDMGLVAVTGPAGDLESQQCADLFSASPELLAVVEKFLDLCPRVHDHDPIAGALADVCMEARVAVRKANGQTKVTE